MFIKKGNQIADKTELEGSKQAQQYLYTLLKNLGLKIS